MAELTPGLLACELVLAAVLGSVFASFITCVACRTVHHTSWVRGRSHCDSCGHELTFIDLIPIVSYITLHGRCRYCGKKISPDSLIAEIVLTCAFMGLVLRFGISPDLAEYMGLSVILLGISVADFMSYEIPNGFILAGLIWYSIIAICKSFLPDPNSFSMPVWLIGGAAGAIVIPGALLVISLIFDKITGKESLGGGDIKLFFMIGWYLGIRKGLLNLIAACLVGLVMASVGKKEKIPFGPAISAAAYLTIIVGDPIIQWYLGLFQEDLYGI